MEYFLQSIAKSISAEFGNTLNRHCMVFPSRRAGLYLMKHLAAAIDKPVWAPSIYTINDLFKTYSSLQVAGSEILIFELFRVYSKIKQDHESFDDFYFWGDLILNDFDDVDKYLVNPASLFENVKDIREIDRKFGSLTEEQVDIIRKFWVNFDAANPTNEKSGFLSIWSVLSDLYCSFRESLRNRNLAYEGMIFRDLAEMEPEKISESTSWDMIHFIGFNALNECEKKLMLSLHKAGKARFYWDYDNSFIKDGNSNSAGFFMRNNLKMFGNNMPSDWTYDTMLSTSGAKVSRRVIETSSDVAQVKLIPELIREIPNLSPENAHQTAVVLCDENLLLPMLTSLPEDSGDINITMGYPLKQTTVYMLIKQLMDLQRTVNTDSMIRFNYRNVENILKHPLLENLWTDKDKAVIDSISEKNIALIPADVFSNGDLLSRVFVKPEDPRSLSDYFRDILSLISLNNSTQDKVSPVEIVQRNIRNEFTYRTVVSLNKLESIINSPEIKFTPETYIRIFDKMLRVQSVPFSGEPLSGIQIMGILETRALDFKNLVMISVNEGLLPAISSGSSFIPFSLREAFGLPSVNHQESVFAYHFYRLLQRAEHVTFTYNSNSEGLRNGEMSRFLTRMKYDESMRPGFINLNFPIKSHGSIPEVLERTNDHVTQLNSRFTGASNGKILSPTAINSWLTCRMKFYYRYVNNIKEPESISEEIDPAMFGTILHEIMRGLYEEFSGRVLNAELIRNMNAKELIRPRIKQAIDKIFKDGDDSLVTGSELIIRDVLLNYIQRILNADQSFAPLTVLRLESKMGFIIDLNQNGEALHVRTGGVADRIDSLGGEIRIVDYKTGIVCESIGSVGELFEDDRKKDSDGWLQTLLYCEAYLSENPSARVRPSIYKIKRMTGNSCTDYLKIKSNGRQETVIDDYKTVRSEFMAGLKDVINKMFSQDEPFTMTKDTRVKCRYCAYKMLCLR
jgi:CRISPR/Cas system-associated exonuclease Cas4 (RecB family)